MALRPTRPQSRAEQIAARDTAQSDAFLREVDDALREDQFFSHLQRYGKPVGVAVVAGLIGLAGWLGWSSYAQDRAEKRAEAMTQALDQIDAGNVVAARLALDPLAADGGNADQAIARLLQADIAQKQGKADEAIKGFAAVYADSATPTPYRDLANIREVSLRFDKMTPDEVVNRLKPLAVPGNAWFGSAGELVGMAYVKQGKKDQAATLFGAIAKDPGTPETLKLRLRRMAGLLGFDAIDDIAILPQRAQPEPQQAEQPQQAPDAAASGQQ